MLTTLSGITMLVNEVQPSNAVLAISVTLLGISISYKLTQSWNALNPIRVIVSRSCTSSRFLALSNRLFTTSVVPASNVTLLRPLSPNGPPVVIVFAVAKDLGISISYSKGQSPKTLYPSSCKFLDRTTLLRLVQPSNAEAPMLTTLSGTTTDRISSLSSKASYLIARTSYPSISDGMASADAPPL